MSVHTQIHRVESVEVQHTKFNKDRAFWTYTLYVHNDSGEHKVILFSDHKLELHTREDDCD